MKLHELVETVFHDNTNTKILINLPPFTTILNLFHFYFDFLCKGLITMYGTNGHLDLTCVTREMFYCVANKMEKIGIEVSMKETQFVTPETRIICNGSETQLESFAMYVPVAGNAFLVSFRPIRI